MFWNKKAALKSETLNKDINLRFQELNVRLNRIEQLIDHLSTKSTQITIENIHIHQPVVEKMEYRLDGLDIEHLSGSLNLGNNFGSKISSVPSTSKPSTPQKKDTAVSSMDPLEKNTQAAAKPSSDPDSSLHRTQSGYRLRRS